MSDLLLQEEDFIRGQQQIEQLQEQSANEEFKSYLAENSGRYFSKETPSGS